MTKAVVGFTMLFTAGLLAPPASSAQDAGSPPPPTQPGAASPVHLRDRGIGIATSMFGTYVHRGEWLIYPFCMTAWVDRRSGIWSGLAILFGVGFFYVFERRENPGMSALETAFELVEILPLVLVSAGVVLLARMASRQREEQLTLIRDLEVARIQTNPYRLPESTIGQIGQLMGRRSGCSHGCPFGVVQVSRSSVAAGL